MPEWRDNEMDQQRDGWINGRMDGELNIWIFICLRLRKKQELPRGLATTIYKLETIKLSRNP